MGTISSGTGLISGLPIQDLVNQLISIQSRPLTLLKSRIDQTNAVRTAYLDLSARLLSLQTAVARLKSSDVFRSTAATSSNDSVLTAISTSSAAPGSYSFTVRRLASTRQIVSTGFASPDSVALGSGTITIESDAAQLDRATALPLLNGGAGVRLGRIRITDRAGGAAEIDLSISRTVADVVDAVNRQSSARVRLDVRGDRLILTDLSGGSSGTLTIEDVAGGNTALDLGIRGAASSAELVGNDVVRLDPRLALSALNDGLGIRRNGIVDDFRITTADGSTIDVTLSDRLSTSTPLAILNGGTGVPQGQITLTNRAGQSATVDLSAAQTVGDVVDAINAAGINVTASLVGSHLVLTDGSNGTGTLSAAEVNGGHTAASLGLDVTSTTNTLTGRDIYRVTTLGDVLRAINLDAENGGRVIAEIAPDGDRIRLLDQTTGAGSLAVASLNDSLAAKDLGLSTTATGAVLNARRLLSGLNGVLLSALNGGSGVAAGTIRLTDRSGASVDIDLGGAETLGDVIDAVNAAGAAIRARVSASGLGLDLIDESGGSGNLIVEDVSGTLAADLGIAVNAAVSSVSNRNLQRQYLSESTRLDSFRSTSPFVRGKFRITSSAGVSAVVDLTQGNEQTLGDVIAEINSRGISVVASINATGDGLLLVDTAGGGGRLTVAEEGGGSTARSLGLLGSAAVGQTQIDGTLETRIELTAGDTLNTLVSRLRASRAPVAASIINDGTGTAPYRLNLTSLAGGAAGNFAIDAGATGLTFATVSEGRDAALLFGPSDATTPLLLTSSTNTFSDVIPGVTIAARSASATPVTIDVATNVEAAVTAIQDFVEAFNGVVGRIDQLTEFDSTTNKRGLLLGDATVQRIESRLYRLVSQTVVEDNGVISRFASVGIRLGSGGELTFDEDRFRAAAEDDPAAVESVFTRATTGLAVIFEEQLKTLTDSTTGLLQTRSDTLSRTVDTLSVRAAQLQTLLDKQRERLTARFQATERALAQLQSQQTALGGLSSLGSISSLSIRS